MKISIHTCIDFHPDIIRRVIWTYFRFNLNFCHDEEMMAKRGMDISNDTIRRNSFG